jgi:DNA mismatch endonuclease, patch repair protein
MNPTDVCGKPDFVFSTERVVIFVDGCFWHGCGACMRLPSTNTDYWVSKIARNRKRDRTVTAKLQSEGWKVLRIWEHQLTSLDGLLVNIRNLMAARSGGS